MKNHITRLGLCLHRPVLALLIAAIAFSCVSTNPTTRYAREHRDREFKSWKDQNKKMDKAEKKKVKDSNKIKHTW